MYNKFGKRYITDNEGVHLGFSGFKRHEINKLLEALVKASIILWKVH